LLFTSAYLKPAGRSGRFADRWLARFQAHFVAYLATSWRPPVVIKDTLHHSKVDVAMNVYDKASAEDIRAGLKVVTKKLLRSDLLPKDLLPAAPKQAEAIESAA
jgi:hypothetical protein